MIFSCMSRCENSVHQSLQSIFWALRKLFRGADGDAVCPFRCCTSCGKVLESIVFSTETVFAKGADGSSQAMGNFVSDSFAGRGGRGLSSYDSNSHEQSLARGKPSKARRDFAHHDYINCCAGLILNTPKATPYSRFVPCCYR